MDQKQGYQCLPCSGEGRQLMAQGNCAGRGGAAAVVQGTSRYKSRQWKNSLA